jgi:hypothetical protein
VDNYNSCLKCTGKKDTLAIGILHILGGRSKSFQKLKNKGYRCGRAKTEVYT